MDIYFLRTEVPDGLIFPLLRLQQTGRAAAGGKQWKTARRCRLSHPTGLWGPGCTLEARGSVGNEA